MTDLSYPQALVMGAIQGVAELFPVSSLATRSWCRRGSAAVGRIW
ncbi:hypothetical protein [Branchiibius hedensis]|nr:hypothetical protein [Branchiibius hedensis]